MATSLIGSTLMAGIIALVPGAPIQPQVHIEPQTNSQQPLGTQTAAGTVPSGQPGVDRRLEQQVLEILRRNPAVLVEIIDAYDRQQRESQQKQQQLLLQQFKTNSPVVLGNSPRKGAALAASGSNRPGPLVLVEFSDFQCPFCARAHQQLQAVLQKHGSEVTLVYKHFPLVSIHDQALPAAKAAWAAGQQGKFWAYHDALFALQPKLSDGLYTKIAQDLKLDLAKFERDRTSPAATAAIAQDFELGRQLGVNGTPMFVVNGQIVSGTKFLDEIETLLRQR